MIDLMEPLTILIGAGMHGVVVRAVASHRYGPGSITR